MKILEWYFFFHHRATLSDVLFRGAPLVSLFSHVEAAGYTVDETWLFFDPQSRGTVVGVTHLHDEVEMLLNNRFANARSVWRIASTDDRIRLPVLRPPVFCVSVCAGLLGWRAYTMRGFEAKLQRNGAEKIEWA